MIEPYEPDAGEQHIKDIRDEFLQDEHPSQWYMEVFFKLPYTIIRHELKTYEQNIDPVDKDERNQRVIWPMNFLLRNGLHAVYATLVKHCDFAERVKLVTSVGYPPTLLGPIGFMSICLSMLQSNCYPFVF